MVTMEAISHFLHSQPCFGTVFVGGEFVPVESGATFATVSPTTEDVLLDSCPRGGPAEIGAAVAAARAAFDSTDWGTRPGAERAVLLRALAGQLAENVDMLAALETADMGKISPSRLTSQIEFR